MDNIQFIWKHGGITGELGWEILVISPKGNTDTRVIGLMKLLWKGVEAIITTRLRASVLL